MFNQCPPAPAPRGYLRSVVVVHPRQEWIFDATDGSGRLLRSRSGHAKPPTLIRYYVRGGSRGRPRCTLHVQCSHHKGWHAWGGGERSGGQGAEGHRLLTTGTDRAFRDVSVIRDSQSVELSQGP